jgi:hypothetical protein
VLTFGSYFGVLGLGGTGISVYTADPDKYTEYIVNADKDTILPPVDGGRQAWAFTLGAFIIGGLM